MRYGIFDNLKKCWLTAEWRIEDKYHAERFCTELNYFCTIGTGKKKKNKEKSDNKFVRYELEIKN